ncbi:hypothetical protein [Actinomyces sp. oral taxon 414]|uniref:hypothetical protein n=1 Tax=Actinomyces sp. oral taxon 414 TaxID=712122 RepID=UPI000A46269B|nr:hypothetical protein [Actinomyces sp. oral taxon 414]
MQLVMLETNGNQRYIFSSPRLRDNIGASSLLTRLEQWTGEALVSTGAAEAWRQSHGLPPAPDADESQWVSRSSGKVIVMVDAPQRARDVIGEVTRRALAQAPGLDISGVFIEIPGARGDAGSAPVDDAALQAVHAEAAAYALRRPPADARFAQIPFLARAKDSALPAAPPLGRGDEAGDDRADQLSLPSRVRRYEAFGARAHLLLLSRLNSDQLDKQGKLLTPDPTKLADMLHAAFSAGEPAADALREEREAASRDEDQNEDRAREERTREERASIRRLETVLQTAPDSGPDEDGPAGAKSSRREAAQAPGAHRQGVPAESSRREAAPLSKIAVIHIDGNGVGGVMRKLADAKERVDATVFEEQVGCKRNDPDSLRRFLLNINERLQRAVEMSFAEAWADIARLAERDAEAAGRSYTAVPVVPVIVGGDDVTVITSGDYALPFAACYLGHYERKTGEDPLLRYLTPPEGSATGPMTAAAGVAVVRRNFPFHLAYGLAEKLVDGAKAVGKTTGPPCSTLGFHALFDTTVLDVKELLSAYTNFTARPFRLVDGDIACDCADCRQKQEDGQKNSDAATRTVPAHEAWYKTRLRVAAFRGLPQEGGEKDPFPHTRAARIRKLLSDAAHGRTVRIGGEEKDPRELAENEWESARASLGRDIDVELGGIEAVFDLLELADLLPDSYLEEVRERPADDPAAPSTPMSPTEVTA